MALDLSGAVAYKRQIAALIMRDRCEVIAETVTDDGFGGQSRTWDPPTTIASDQPCYYTETLSPDQQEFVARRGLVVEAAIFIPADIAAQVGQRIALTAVQGIHGGTYTIRGLTAFSYEVTRTAFVARVG